MRSRLEAWFAANLDSMDIPWLYEPFAYGYQGGQYLGDFLLPHVQSPLSHPWPGWGAQSLVFDVKGPDPSPQELHTLQERMAAAVHASEPAAQLAIVTESLMLRGLYLIQEAPAPGALRLGTWEYGTWGECRCGVISPVITRGGVLHGLCLECDGSVFVPCRRAWFPAAA
jgi:hypothetical protein